MSAKCVSTRNDPGTWEVEDQAFSHLCGLRPGYRRPDLKRGWGRGEEERGGEGRTGDKKKRKHGSFDLPCLGTFSANGTSLTGLVGMKGSVLRQ